MQNINDQDSWTFKLRSLIFGFGVIPFLLSCASPQPNASAPPRPSALSAKCMENAISTLKRARIRFNDSRSDAHHCWVARDLIESANRRAAPVNGVIVATDKGVVASIGSTYKEPNYSQPCPKDQGPNAYQSYTDHTFALESVAVQACPASFQNAYQIYTSVWRNLREIAAQDITLPLAAFHAVMHSKVPRNVSEQRILAEERRLTAQLDLWRIYQLQTGWCFDGNDFKDVIHWRGCPRL